MLFFRYIIENLRFIYRYLHPKYKLINVDFNQLTNWDRVSTKEQRDLYFPFGKYYNWEKLKYSLNKIGYIPSIVVSLYSTKTDYTYTIKDGHHRFFLLSQNSRPKDKIKIWVNKKSSKEVKKFTSGDHLIKTHIENKLKTLDEERIKRIKPSPNYKRLKD